MGVAIVTLGALTRPVTVPSMGCPLRRILTENRGISSRCATVPSGASFLTVLTVVLRLILWLTGLLALPYSISFGFVCP